VNYFELHIGDYAEATAHLTFVEDAAYTRLLRKYYSTEKPLPGDLKAVQRLVAARSKEEREAVETVLNEFFTLQDDGWHNTRCDAEIARFQAGEPERAVKKANEDNRLKKHRDERARLFQQLTDAGLHAPWNIGMAELRAMVKALPATGLETPAPPLPVTAPATPATATQTPITNHQTPILNSESSSQASTEVGAGPQPDDDDQAVRLQRSTSIAALLSENGIEGTPDHAIVRSWAADSRMNRDLLTEAITKARKSNSKRPMPLTYLEATVLTLLERQATPPRATVPQATPILAPVPRRPQGNEPKGLDESYEDWQTRVAAFEQAQRQAAAR
jgi:uncharacterized protein YdaU (DUF1376 family)